MNHDQDEITLGKVITHSVKLLPRIPGLIKASKLIKLEHSNESVGVGPCIEEVAEQSPSNTAILFEERSINYKEFNQWANRIANHFLGLGYSKGDVVGVFVPNRPELLAIITGLNKIGVIAALVNTSQKQKVLTHSLEMVSPKAIIVGEELVEAFNEVRDNLSCQLNYFFSDCDTLSEATSSSSNSSSSNAPQGFENFEQAIASCSKENPVQSKDCMPHDVCFYIYTSGTTGMPKAVAFTNARWLKAYAGFGFTAMRFNKNDVMYVTLPFYHATALVICWGSVLAGHSTLALRRTFSASEFWTDVRKYKATSFGYVGELCRYLMNQESSPQDLNNGIKKIVGNGMRPNIWGEFKARFGISEVVELYASSEGNIGMTNLLNFDNTVGLCPFPYALVRYDQEAGQAVKDDDGHFIRVKPGEPGLLITKITRSTQPASYTDPEKSKQLILKNAFKEGDAWFNTGDMMRDIGFKHLQFVDRLGDTFRWKGENVSTTELENIISEYSAVAEAVVYGVEIPGTNGRAGMATIVPQESKENFSQSLDDFLIYLGNELPSYAVPVFLRIKTGLDMTGTFKYKKSDLKKEGFNTCESKDAFYVCLPKANNYEIITEEIYQNLVSNKYKY